MRPKHIRLGPLTLDEQCAQKSLRLMPEDVAMYGCCACTESASVLKSSCEQLTPDARRVGHHADDHPAVTEQAQRIPPKRVKRVDLQAGDLSGKRSRLSVSVARAGQSLRCKTHSGVIKPSPRAMIENGRPWRWNGCGGPTTFWMTMSTVPIPCVSMIAMRPVNGSSPRTIWCRSGLMARQEVSKDDQRL